MTLEQLMAFTVNPDHARQVQVWDVIHSSWNKEPFQIRRMLTETSVRASDRRAIFVGVEAYEAAGGTMLHDLFQGDDGGWLEDPALLDRLVTEKLQAEAETVAVEGWKWIEVALDLPYGYSYRLRSLSGDPAPMTDEEGAAHAKLLAEYRALEEEYAGQDEIPDKVDTRLGVLEAEMERIETRPLIFDAGRSGGQGRSSRSTATARWPSIAAMCGQRMSLLRRQRSRMILILRWRGRVLIVISPMAMAVPLLAEPSLCRVASRSELTSRRMRMTER